MINHGFSRSFLLLGLVFIAAVVIRIYNLTNVPYGFHEDEAHIGYNAYSLLKTGHDKNNVFLPLAIDQFGDYRPSGLHFLTVPSVAAFGLTVFATRLPVAIVGSLSIIVLYFLTLEVFGNARIAFISAAWMSVTPWQIIASRSTSESIVAQFFVLTGMYLLILCIKKQTRNLLPVIFAAVSFIISFLFYHAARFFVPVMLFYFVLYMFIYAKTYRKIITSVCIAVVCVIAALLLILKFSNGGSRPVNISIFNSPATKLLIDQQVRYAGNPPTLMSRILHNKYINYPEAILSNYLAHFDSEFLYFKGGRPPRYQVSGSGNFYLIEGLFLLVGFSMLLTSFVKNWKTIFSLEGSVAVWLLIGPLPAALTYEDIPHFQRSIMMLPAFIMLASYGLYQTYQVMKDKTLRYVLVGIVICITAFNCIFFFHSYFIESFGFQTLYRNEGEKELTEAIARFSSEGYSVIMTTQQSNTLIFYLFYDRIDPHYFQSIGSPRDTDMLHFKNIIFSQAQCPTNDPRDLLAVTNPKTIFVNRFDCIPPKNRYVTVENIKRPDGTVAFKILKR